MSHLNDLFFIFTLIFITIDHINSLKQPPFFFAIFLEYLILVLDGNIDEESELFANSESSAPGKKVLYKILLAQDVA